MRMIVGVMAAIAIALSGCSSGENQELLDEIQSLRQEVAELSESDSSATSTTTAEVSTTVSTTSTTATVEVIPSEVILLASYEWGEQSNRVVELQGVIGATPDGQYGPKTREAHIEALKDRGLDSDHVPSPPAGNTPSQVAQGDTTSGNASNSGGTATPEGGLIFERCGDCGQGFSSGSCANWTVKAVNSSNVTVTSFTFAPPSAYWRDRSSGYGDDAIEVPADSPARTLNVSLAPYESGTYRFQICTTTPPPGDGWEYTNKAPYEVRFKWSNGAQGSACYNLGCY